MLKSYRVGGVVVSHKTLVSAPVPIGIRGLGQVDSKMKVTG